MDLACPVREMAATDGKRLAISDGKRCLSYAEFDLFIQGIAKFLSQEGFSQGDIIAFLGTNSIEQAALLFAALRLGLIFMPLNIRLGREAWQDQIRRSDAKILIYDSGFDPGQVSCDKITLDSMLISDGSPTPSENNIIYDNPAVIIFSSGTSSSPRGVVLTSRNLYSSALGTNRAVALEKNDRWLAVLPFFHVGGLLILLRCALAGSSVFIMDRFDIDLVLDAVTKSQVNIVSLVPTMLQDLIKNDRDNHLQKLKTIILGGAPIHRDLSNKLEKYCLPVLITYGMTETASMITLSEPGEYSIKPLSSGKILPYRKIKIVATDGRPCPTGKAGKILASGEILFSHYIGETRTKNRQNDWFDTGDIGHLDDEGSLFVTGRADRMIISGGENISLDEIELAISQLDGIEDAAVLARNDKIWGQRPLAFVVFSGNFGQKGRLPEILAQKLPKLMIPDKIKEVDEIPLTGIGKHDRQVLIKRFPELFDN